MIITQHVSVCNLSEELQLAIVPLIVNFSFSFADAECRPPRFFFFEGKKIF